MNKNLFSQNPSCNYHRQSNIPSLAKNYIYPKSKKINQRLKNSYSKFKKIPNIFQKRIESFFSPPLSRQKR